MDIERIVVGLLQVNCYLVSNPAAGACLVIDPGDNATDVTAKIRNRDLEPVGILLTHAHVDHIRAVGALSRTFDIPVMLNAADGDLYRSPDNALAPWAPAATDLPETGTVRDDLDGLSFTVIHTPGHTPGGVCYYFPAAGALFSGDTLFRESIGRTDLPGGNHSQLIESIRRNLLPLPGETRVLPGHGPETTIRDEADKNPYL